MIASKIEGLLLEKETRQVTNQETGEIQIKHYLRLFQEGVRNIVNIHVPQSYLSKYKEGQKIELTNVKLGAVGNFIWAKINDENLQDENTVAKK